MEENPKMIDTAKVAFVNIQWGLWACHMISNPPNTSDPLKQIRSVLIGITLCNVVFTSLKLYRESISSSPNIGKVHLDRMEEQHKLGQAAKAILQNYTVTHKANIFDEIAAEDYCREGILVERALRSCARHLRNIESEIRKSKTICRPADVCIALINYDDLTDASIKHFKSNGELKNCATSQFSDLRTRIDGKVQDIKNSLRKKK